MEIKKVNDAELNSVTGGLTPGEAWYEAQRQNCAGVTAYRGYTCDMCRCFVHKADGNRNGQLYKYCTLFDIFLE